MIIVHVSEIVHNYDGSNIANPHSMFKRKPMGAGPAPAGDMCCVQGNTSKKSILVQGNTSKESTLVLHGYPLGAGPTPIGLRLNMECGFAILLPSYKQSH